MRENVRAFIEAAVEAFDLQGPVYEFGAFQVEGQPGSDLRELFAGKPYVGCDMRKGPGVDRIEDLAELTLPDGAARTIICVDTLEHVFEARRAVDEMIRVLAPGGILLVSAPMDFRLHDYPSDYWRLTPSCVDRLFAPLAGTIIGSQGVESFPHTVFGIGCKDPVRPELVEGLTAFVDGFERRVREQAVAVGWQKRFKDAVTGWLRSKGERRRHREYHAARFVLQMQADPSFCPDPRLFGAGAKEPTGTRLDLS